MKYRISKLWLLSIALQVTTQEPRYDTHESWSALAGIVC
jgi:hypothetical protein